MRRVILIDLVAYVASILDSSTCSASSQSYKVVGAGTREGVEPRVPHGPVFQLYGHQWSDPARAIPETLLCGPQGMVEVR